MQVFIASTPYHVFLALLWEGRRSDDVLILLDGYGNLSRYKKVLGLFFNKFYYFDLSYETKLLKILNFNNYFSTSLKRDLKMMLAEIFCSENIIYVFNDSTPVAQYLLLKIEHKIAIYIEDGAAAYNQHFFNCSSFKKKIYKIIYGDEYDFVHILGTSKYIKKSIFTYPELVRSENLNFPQEKYRLCMDANLKIKSLLSVFPDDLARIKNLSERESVLFLMPLNNILKENDSHLKIIRECIADEAAKGKLILVKRHPLDEKMAELPSYLNGAIEISAYLSAEVLPASLPLLNAVYGEPNTSLLAFKFLFPNISVKCIPGKHLNIDRFSRCLKLAGVEFLH